LFPAEAEKLGYAKMNRAGFVAFMKSKVVQKMRDAINKDKTVLAKAKNLPALKAKVANLTKQLETMQADLLAKATQLRDQRRPLPLRHRVALGVRCSVAWPPAWVWLGWPIRWEWVRASGRF
jgi:DNA repair ATPase RecN